METETLDKLYLEWSQFTTARTKRERDAVKAIEGLLAEGLMAEWPEKGTGSSYWDYAKEVLQDLKVPGV